MTSIHKIIAAIVPDIYCSPEKRNEVKALVKELGYLAAAEEAETINSDYMDLEKELIFHNPFKHVALHNPIEKHHLEYDNFTGQSLEQLYFWILDYINKEFDSSDKVIDNFSSAAGSSHFGDMSIRIGQIQQTAQRNMELANTVLKSLINLVYDLKDFKLRIKDYDKYHSKNQNEKRSAILSLKERWLDLVDIRRGQASIRSLSTQFDFVTLLNAFMAAESTDSVKKIDLNNIVKNVLTQRLSEFFKWIEESEKQIKTRYEIEKKYLKTQVDTLKLYSKWAKPYLQAAKQLEQRALQSSALVTIFETTLLELTLLGIGKYNIEIDISNDNLPKAFRKVSQKKFNYITVTELKFRASPQKQQYGGSFSFRGRVEIDLTSYALTEAELKILKEQVEKDDLGDLMDLISGATTESLEMIQSDIDEFLKEEPIKTKNKSMDINPFTALFYKSPKKKEKEIGITKDSDAEKAIRNQVIIKARLECRKFYNSYKGANDMPTFF